MMYESWNPGTVVDDQGRPLANGRVTVHVHDSYAIADLYTYEGDEYIPAPNPQFLDESGRLQATIFVELGVYDVEIQKSNGDGTYEDFDNFEFGIDAKLDDVNRTEVDTVDDLADLDPSVCSSVVTVNSVPRRDYVWDAGSVDTPDGGIVVDSNVEGDGNWILLWESPYLPSSVYGVTPGDISNLGAWLTYPDYVGSMGLRTPPCVLLEQGSYALGTVVCNKRLAVDRNASWSGQVRTNQDIEVMGSHAGAIGDIYFTKGGCTAHSSWYDDVDKFWHCGADTLIVDSVDNFSSKKLKSTVALTGKTVQGQGTKVTEYVNGACFHLSRVCSVPGAFFTANDYVKVSSGFGDEAFAAAGAWDPGLISQGHHREYEQVPELQLFASADRWLETMLERRSRMSTILWSQKTIDLLGRKVSAFTLPSGSFDEVHNAVVNGAITLGQSVTLYGVKATVLCSGVGIGVTAYNSELIFPGAQQGLSSVNLNDCYTTVQGTGFNPADTSVTVTGGSFSGGIVLGDMNLNTYAASHPVTFRDVRFRTAWTWKVHYLNMTACSGPIKVNCYPYLDGSGYYTWNIYLRGNEFTGASRVWFTVFATSDYPHGELDGKCRFASVNIVGNRFETSDTLGIKRMHWHPLTLNTLIASGNTWEYRGNTGNCPRLNPGFVPNAGKWPTTQGSNPKWRIYDGTFNIWCPYLGYGDGSVASAEEPTGTNPYMTSAVFAFFFTDNLSDGIGHYLYGYRTADVIGNIPDPTDEDANNSFSVKLAMGALLPSVPTFDTGTTFFPGLDTV